MKDFSPKEWNLSKRLLATIAYFDVFDLPLRADLLKRLVFGDMNFNILELEVALAEINEFVQQLDGYVYLQGKSNLIAQQVSSTNRKEKLIKKARKAGWIFRACPFVEFVAICNYLPYGVVEENSDIDLLVVVKPGRIFIARLFLTFLTHMAGKRRYSDKVEGRFCLSFYLNRDSLALAPLLIQPHDVYMGYWLLALLPIYGQEQIYTNLKRGNDQWMKQYFDNLQERYEDCNYQRKQKNILGKVMQWILKGRLGNWTEAKLKSYFVKRHYKNLKNLPENASVEVSSDRLKFHNNDKRKFFAEQFEERLKRLKLI